MLRRKFFRPPLQISLIMAMVLIFGLIGSRFTLFSSALAAATNVPTTPSALQATSVTSNSVKLGWAASTSAKGIKYYTVYRNGKKLTTTIQLTYVSTGLTPLTTYSYTVSATSKTLQVSKQSSPVSVTTLATPPLLLVATPTSATKVTLSWAASSSAAKLAGYQVYRDGNLLTSVSNATTGYVDTIAMPQTTYQYFVKGYYGTSVTQPTNTASITTPAVTPPAPIAATGTPISGCADITAPGAYYLTSDVTGMSLSPCIHIHDTSNVTFNCDNHVITSTQIFALTLTNVTGFVLTNCVISNMTLEIDSSANGLLQANSFVNGAIVNTQTNQGIKTQFNNFSYGVYQGHSDTNDYVGFNTFGWQGAIGADSILSVGGSNNTVEYNVVTTNGTQNTTQQGMDDGIGLQDENADLVRANTINTVWDCGIETSGLVSNSTFVGNKIIQAYKCGLGGWYWSSWHHNTVVDNTFDGSRYMFWFYRLYGLRSNEQYIYFDDNTFENNVLTNPADNHSPQAWFNLQALPSGISAAQTIVANNLFIGNNFGKVGYPPYINPVSLAIDGGGNVCSTQAPILGTNVLTCH